MFDLSTQSLILYVFIILCIFITALIYLAPWLDMRSLARWRRLDDWGEPYRFDIFERPDLGFVFTILTAAALAVAGYLGWRLPLDIQSIASGTGFNLRMPQVEPAGALVRSAQVIGAICLVMIALRVLRPALYVAGVVITAALTFMAIGYIAG